MITYFLNFSKNILFLLLFFATSFQAKPYSLDQIGQVNCACCAAQTIVAALEITLARVQADSFASGLLSTLAGQSIFEIQDNLLPVLTGENRELIIQCFRCISESYPGLNPADRLLILQIFQRRHRIDGFCLTSVPEQNCWIRTEEGVFQNARPIDFAVVFNAIIGIAAVLSECGKTNPDIAFWSSNLGYLTSAIINTNPLCNAILQEHLRVLTSLPPDVFGVLSHCCIKAYINNGQDWSRCALVDLQLFRVNRSLDLLTREDLLSDTDPRCVDPVQEELRFLNADLFFEFINLVKSFVQAQGLSYFTREQAIGGQERMPENLGRIFPGAFGESFIPVLPRVHPAKEIPLHCSFQPAESVVVHVFPAYNPGNQGMRRTNITSDKYYSKDPLDSLERTALRTVGQEALHQYRTDRLDALNRKAIGLNQTLDRNRLICCEHCEDLQRVAGERESDLAFELLQACESCARVELTLAPAVEQAKLEVSQEEMYTRKDLADVMGREKKIVDLMDQESDCYDDVCGREQIEEEQASSWGNSNRDFNSAITQQREQELRVRAIEMYIKEGGQCLRTRRSVPNEAFDDLPDIE